MASSGTVFLAGVGSVALALTAGFMAAVWVTSPNASSRPDSGGVTRPSPAAEMPVTSMQQPSPAAEPSRPVRMVSPATTGQAEAEAEAAAATPEQPKKVEAKERKKESRKATRKKKRNAKRRPEGSDSPAASSYAQQNGFWR